jgi:hypothetical protein
MNCLICLIMSSPFLQSYHVALSLALYFALELYLSISQVSAYAKHVKFIEQLFLTTMHRLCVTPIINIELCL